MGMALVTMRGEVLRDGARGAEHDVLYSSNKGMCVRMVNDPDGVGWIEVAGSRVGAGGLKRSEASDGLVRAAGRVDAAHSAGPVGA